MASYCVQLWNNIAECPVTREVVEASGYPDAVMQVLRRLGMTVARYVEVTKLGERVGVAYLDFVACADGQFVATAGYAVASSCVS